MIYMKNMAILAAVSLAVLSGIAMAQERPGVVSTLDSLIIPEGDIMLVPEEKEYTNNGLTLSLGKVSNSLDFSILAKNMTFAGNSLPIDMIIAPNSTWTYARLDGMLIIPKTPAVIDAWKTSFYQSSRQLHISFDGTDEVDIYFKSYGPPRIVISDANIRWSFKDSVLNVKSTDVMRDIDVYWLDETNDTVFVEDRRKIESLEYVLSRLAEELPKANELLVKLRIKNDGLRKALFSVESRLTAVASEKSMLNDAIVQANSTSTKMENMVSGNIVMSQSAFALAVIIAVISAMVLVDALTTRRKGEIR
ncbi:MAG: hypothetical protein HYT73_04080 [Candidatus Aenigmarchaeota archaeon]|nr:hypothetical protein [Candidatus Aenigmarchaeota archaeon]